MKEDSEISFDVLYCCNLKIVFIFFIITRYKNCVWLWIEWTHCLVLLLYFLLFFFEIIRSINSGFKILRWEVERISGIRNQKKE